MLSTRLRLERRCSQVEFKLRASGFCVQVRARFGRTGAQAQKVLSKYGVDFDYCAIPLASSAHGEVRHRILQYIFMRSTQYIQCSYMRSTLILQGVGILLWWKLHCAI